MSDGDRSAATPATTAAVGLCLLPSELLQEIFLRLALPELLRLRSVSKVLGSLVAGPDFRLLYDLRSQRGSGGGDWLFVYKKRPPSDAVLRGFNDRSGRWFHIPVAGMLAQAMPPGDDLYLLAASGRFFLFASNARRELVVVNLTTGEVRRIPACPLGPRGTSSWRRSGLKLVADRSGAQRFDFLFAEMVHGRPVLFEFRSETDTWRQMNAVAGHVGRGAVCLNLVHLGSESAVVSSPSTRGDGRDALPVAHQLRFPAEFEGGPPVGLATNDRFHVYGDGNVVVVRSAEAEGGCGGGGRARVVTGVEMLGISGEGRKWEAMSAAPAKVVEEAWRGQAYGVMMGCVAERDGVVRVVFMSNLRGSWGFAWLSYDRRQGTWECVPVPDYGGMKDLNMAGIAVDVSRRHNPRRYKWSLRSP